MKRALALALLFVCAGMVSAAEVQSVEVHRDGKRYHIDMQTRLDAEPARAYAVFSDWRRLPEINRSVRSAQVLAENADGTIRLATEVHFCVAIFCRELRQVQDMHSLRNDATLAITANVLPALSDLRYGKAAWTMTPCAGETCLHFSADLEPDFWVPPLIGPWLIERKLRSQAVATSEGIERLARQTP
ncbi:MAG: SRPBCC family protein [Stenotrophobium sp.]